jgi:SiaC family regulatory phosphoprotein
MENFYQDRTIKSPLIKGDCRTGEILIHGRSYPENAVEFYGPFLAWFEELKSQNLEAIRLRFDLEYFNTSSAGILFDFIEKVASFRENTDVKITWCYEEDDLEMAVKGKSLQANFEDLFILEEKKV